MIIEVALFRRAWIEIIRLSSVLTIYPVALFRRAWIEIRDFILKSNLIKSLSSGERGLK